MAGHSAGSTPAPVSESVDRVSALPILIIDDAPEDLETFQDYLREGGYQNVQTADGGAAGIAALTGADTSGEAPTVVVVDIRMPPPDGYEVLARIKAMDQACRPLTLAVTGDSSQASRVAALQAGASDFITKPCDPVELLLRVLNLAKIKWQERELRHALKYQRLADQYRTLADNSVDVIVHHRGRQIVWISPSAETVFGWSREQWLGTEFLHHIHPDDIDTMSATLDQIAHGRSITARVRVATADGGCRWVEGRTKPYIDDAGNPDGMIAALRVVDDQIEIERQRTEAEKRYQLLFESAPDAVLIVGPDGRITGANAQTDQMFGYPREELIGTQVDMLVPQRFRGTHAAHRAGFLADPTVRPMGAGLELWGLRRDGSEFPVAISLSPLRVGPNSEVLAAIRDVTAQREAERQRAEAQARYQLLFESAPDAVLIVGPDGRITGANAQTDQMFGYPREELIGTQVDMLVPQRFRGTHAAHRAGFLADPTVRPMGAGLELWGLRRDGSEFPVAISLSPLRVGPNSEVLAAIRDVTAQREAERQRAEAETQYHLLADNAVDVIAHVRGRKVVWISPSAEAAYGWPVDAWIGTDFTPRICPDDPDAAAAVIEQFSIGQPFATRVRTDTADDGHRWVEARAKPYIDAEGNPDGMIVSIRVVDEQVAAEEQLKAEKERFEAVVANAPPAISVRDLQHRYTMVNETFCQLFGQESVGEVIGRTDSEILPAEVLERSQRAEVGLLAGESSFEEESIQRGPENILVMTQRFPLRSSEGAITELVTIRTDITHRRKAEQEAAERALWEERLRAAIGDGRLLVYSQPIVDITTKETIGDELLVRLRAVDSAEIKPPSEFLPQCEQHGLMPMIDRYMVGRAVDLAHTGRQVSVNITGQTIGDQTAMSEILATLAAAGPDIANKIMFEITETAAIGSPEMAKAFSHDIRALGCRVALDDFGTGYGTFTELRHLELDTLKIDLSFVQNMLVDRDDERVVNTIIFVAQTYGLTTIAEGVETQEVLDRLAQLGVDRAQGYFFDRPQPVVW